MARLTLARKIAAIVLTLWKKGESFDIERLKPQVARASPVESPVHSWVIFSWWWPAVLETLGFEGEYEKPL